MITNVTFNQRSDGSFLVDVYYDLYDTEGDTMSVIMLASDDAGYITGQTLSVDGGMAM